MTRPNVVGYGASIAARFTLAKQAMLSLVAPETVLAYAPLKRAIPRVGGFRSFNTARRTICGFEAMLWLRKGFGFAGAWTVRETVRVGDAAAASGQDFARILEAARHT